MTSPSLTNIPDRSPDEARAECQRKDMASWYAPESWCGSPWIISNHNSRVVASFDYKSDRDAILRIARAHDALVRALEECADDLESEINARAAGELPRRISRDMEAVVRARAALVLAKGKENV